jgi:hypothetical protein
MTVSAIKFGIRTLSTNKGIVKELKVTAPDSIKLSKILKAISDKYTWKQLEDKKYVTTTSGVTNIFIYIKTEKGTLPYGSITRKLLADWYKIENKPYRNSLGKIVE